MEASYRPGHNARLIPPYWHPVYLTEVTVNKYIDNQDNERALRRMMRFEKLAIKKH